MKSIILPHCLCWVSRLRAGLFGFVLLFSCVAARADLFVAPTAVGTGSGTSAANAASYVTASFWTGTVQPALASGPLTVWFTNGTYNGGQLKLTSLGHPLNTCTLRATTDGSVTLNSTSAQQSILWLYGCQNFVLRGFRFTGAANQNGLNLSYYPSPLKSGTRNVTVTGCWFENLTGLAYGGILFGANHDITIDGCHFNVVTGPSAKHVHALYVGNASQGISVLNSDFTNIGGEYVRFRDDTEFAVVDGCTFHSTAEVWNSPFISVVLYNQTAGEAYATEFFGTNFQFTNNVFRYDVPNASPAEDSYCFAHYIYNSGKNAPPGDGLDYWLDSTEASTLNSGTVAQKESLLSAEMGLTNARVKIYNEEYHGATWATAYRGFDPDSTAGGYESPVNISNWPGTTGTLLTAPILRNGQFDFKGNRLRCWYTFTGNEPVDHPGLNGTAKAIKLSSASNTQFGQWLRGPNGSTVTLHCLFGVGSFTGTGVKFQVQLYHNEVTNSYLAFAVDSSGQLGYMNGSTFVAVPALGTIQFCNDANGDGDYVDAGDTLRWYQLRITVDYSGATPSFTIARGAANTASDYSFSSGAITAWVNGAPPTGSKIGLINFVNTTANVIVDEVW